jgi:hypothetical protein
MVAQLKEMARDLRDVHEARWKGKGNGRSVQIDMRGSIER